MYRRNSLAGLVSMHGRLHLTRSERKFLSLLASGLSDNEIASVLGNAERDVSASVDRLLVKTSAKSRVELALFGLAASENTNPGAWDNLVVVQRTLPRGDMPPARGRFAGAFDAVDFVLFAAIVAIVSIAVHLWNAPGTIFPRNHSEESSNAEAASKEAGSESGPKQPGLTGPAKGAGGVGADSALADESPAVAVRIVPAHYNDEARYANFHAKISVVAVVNEYGGVDRVEFTAPVPFHLDRGPIQEAASQWLFKPARHRGKPVSSRVVEEVPFK